jgi:hypothetical protein
MHFSQGRGTTDSKYGAHQQKETIEAFIGERNVSANPFE